MSQAENAEVCATGAAPADESAPRPRHTAAITPAVEIARRIAAILPRDARAANANRLAPLEPGSGHHRWRCADSRSGRDLGMRRGRLLVERHDEQRRRA